MTDAENIYDSLARSESSQFEQQDKRTAIELFVVRETLESTGVQVCWVLSHAMVGD